VDHVHSLDSCLLYVSEQHVLTDPADWSSQRVSVHPGESGSLSGELSSNRDGLSRPGTEFIAATSASAGVPHIMALERRAYRIQIW
jgi:hypothetical protein